eukprot:c21807_g1_i1 orf=300-1616(+)
MSSEGCVYARDKHFKRDMGIMELELDNLDCLIPGLPNDLALQCLVRVPRTRHGYLRCVNSSWRSMVGSSVFYGERRRLGLAEESVIIVRELHVNVDGNRIEPIAQCVEFDVKTQSTSKVLASWSHQVAKSMFLRGQACVQIREDVLFVGGYNRVDSLNPSSHVYKYCILTKKIAKAADMLNPRAQFASAVINDFLYVAGGKNANREWSETAEVYDSYTDCWSPIANMPRPIQVHSCFRHGNRLFVRGFVDDKKYEEMLGTDEVIFGYDPKRNEWKEEVAMVGGFSCSPCCVVVSTDEDNLLCSALETFITPFSDDTPPASLRISKLVNKEEKGKARWKWETSKALDKVCTMSVFCLHGSVDKSVIVIPYDLPNTSRWNAFGYSTREERSKASSTLVERKEVMVCGGGHGGTVGDSLVEVYVRCCYCYSCSFQSAPVKL